jgi:hypothetical protein
MLTKVLDSHRGHGSTFTPNGMAMFMPPFAKSQRLGLTLSFLFAMPVISP